MSNRYPRINLNKENKDSIANDFENNLEKSAVQPRKQESLFDQINGIMNGRKQKFSSVEEKVNEMLERSGLNEYLKQQSKTADPNESVTIKEASAKFEENLPEILKQVPNIKNTIQNLIKDSRGNLSLPSILHKVKDIHHNDISDEKLWHDDKLLVYISRLNLAAKTDNPDNYSYNSMLGRKDNDKSDSNTANNQLFTTLNPTKF